MSEKKVNTDNATRDKDYHNLVKQIEDEGVCPFCSENLTQFHPNPILKETEYWSVTENAFPYDGVEQQILFIYKTHIELFSEIKPSAWAELQDLINWTAEEFGFATGSLLLRFGHTENTGASVQHIHAQVIHSDPKKSDYQPVTTRIG